MVSERSYQKTTRTICLLILTLGILSVLPMTTYAQDTLSFTVNRNVGMGFGNYISGTFTLQGSGPDSIDNLTVYFNDAEVHFVTGNAITWQFNTGNYDGGTTNITLMGITETGQIYSSSRIVVFIGAALTSTITIVIFALVVVLVLAKYGPRIMRMRNK